jgi:hypothetical protein
MEGIKYDQGKPKFALMPKNAIRKIANRMEACYAEGDYGSELLRALYCENFVDAACFAMLLMDTDYKPQYSGGYDMIPHKSMVNVAKVLTFGAVKYGPDNWRIVPNAIERYESALFRHIYTSGETIDPESGLPHLAHAACCIMFLIELKN